MSQFMLSLYRSRASQEKVQLTGPALRVFILRQLLQQTQKRVFFQTPSLATRGMRGTGLRMGTWGQGSCATSAGLCSSTHAGVDSVEGKRGVLRVGGWSWDYIQCWVGEEG